MSPKGAESTGLGRGLIGVLIMVLTLLEITELQNLNFYLEH